MAAAAFLGGPDWSVISVPLLVAAVEYVGEEHTLPLSKRSGPSYEYGLTTGHAASNYGDPVLGPLGRHTKGQGGRNVFCCLCNLLGHRTGRVYDHNIQLDFSFQPA